MNVLVLNSGSSSLKYQLINVKTKKPLIKGHADGIGLPTCVFKYSIIKNKSSEDFSKKIKIKNHIEAVKMALKSVEDICDINEISAVGHRVVHGGEKYSKATKIDANVIKTIEKLSSLAPLHNPPNLEGIKACKKALPKVPQVAVFDTAFHQTIPEHAYMYAIPSKMYKKHGIRKYGFHGTSHKYVMEQACKILKKKKVNIVTCHLGNGSSLAAIEKNICIDTSMGLTPLQGLIMGTRSGDIDPAIVEFICEKEKMTPAQVTKLLNKESGLKGICNYSDMRTIYEKSLKGDKKCKLALEMFGYRVATYINSYIGFLSTPDAIVFTAGIGEGAYFARKAISKYLSKHNFKLDAKNNNKNAQVISKKDSKIKMLVIPTNEELMIAKETKEILKL